VRWPIIAAVSSAHHESGCFIYIEYAFNQTYSSKKAFVT